METVKRLYFDLDGPILDVSARYYKTHLAICEQIGIASSLSQREYWAMKRAKQPLSVILGSSTAPLHTTYMELWRKTIESDDMLILDGIHPFAHAVLSDLTRTVELWLVSLRSRKDAAFAQINRLGLVRYFKKTLFVDHGPELPHRAKHDAIVAEGSASHSIFIGDTEVDIDTAALLGIPAIVVLSGIRNYDFLRSYGRVMYIVDDVRDVRKKVTQ